MKKQEFRGVVFDLDGTLIDTLGELGKLTNTILEKYRYPTHPISAYRHFVGEGAETLIKNALCEKGTDSKLVSRCLADFIELYNNNCGDGSMLYEGIYELLDGLVNKGIKISVLSNKPHELTLKNIDIFIPDIPFDIIFGQRDGVPKKPDPAGALEIAERLCIPPSEFLYLGDTSIDMRTAVSAGMFPVGVLWGFRDRDELVANGAKQLIKAPSELFDLFF